jgi:hypothetical protein
MSLGHGASIVLNGLVMCIDAANPKSYPGAGTAWNDISGNSNNGTLVNGPVYSTSDSGIFSFDGIDDYVDCGSVSNLNNTITGLTVSIWFKVGTLRTEMLVENGTTFTTNTFYIAQENANNVSFAIANDSAQYQRIYGTSSYTVGRWYNFAGVWASGASILAYVNGQDTSQSILSPFGNLTSVRSGNANLWVGNRPAGNIPFSGSLSTTTIYNRALSATEISQNFNALRGRYGL